MPDVTSTLLAMYQQIIGGSSAREQSALEAECARRVITSGLTIAAGGAFTIPGNVTVTGTLSVANFSVTGTFSVPGTMTVGTLVVTGDATIGGVLRVTGFGGHSLIASGVGFQSLTIQNTLAGTGNATQVVVSNDAGASGVLQILSSTFTANGPNLPNGVVVLGNAAGGLSVSAPHPSGAVRFYTGGLTERMRVHPSGAVSIGNTTDPGTAGLLSVTATTGIHTFIGTSPTSVGLRLQNTSNANGASTALYVGNDTDASLIQLSAYSSGTGAGGFVQPNGAMLYGGGAGGLSILAGGATGVLRFYAGGTTELMRLNPTGELVIGAASAPFPTKLALFGNMGTSNLLILQNSNAGNSGNFQLLVNSAGALAGSIAQTAVTTVAYNTTSDARLKDDLGQADDLTALRGVVVHDFTWTGDGRHDRGVFAQEAHAVFPRAITAGTDARRDDGQLALPWMTDYSKFVPDLIVGWQQHEADLADLRAQLKERRH